jgi:uncharacterized protein (TIGR03790 family)
MGLRATGGIGVAAFLLCFALGMGRATGADLAPAARVLIVVNNNSPVSKSIGEYYARRRGVPLANVCAIQAPANEEILRPDYDRLAAQVRDCLVHKGLVENIYYIVTTLGVPLKIAGALGLGGDAASVDSELALLYADIKSHMPHRTDGVIPNPFFSHTNTPFSHPQFQMYMVTRLAAFDFAGVRDMIDRASVASNRGKFIIDVSNGNAEGDGWLRDAAAKLPLDRVVLDDTSRPLYDQSDVIGYASWGSNDDHHDRRFANFRWLPGGIATEFVSTDGRTFQRPPESWVPSRDWTHKEKWFAGAPQSLSADFILEGATGASGHVYEPYLAFTPHPDFLLPAYYSGRNLAESYYLAIPALSWQNIVLGDPLCSLGPPK